MVFSPDRPWFEVDGEPRKRMAWTRSPDAPRRPAQRQSAECAKGGTWQQPGKPGQGGAQGAQGVQGGAAEVPQSLEGPPAQWHSRYPR